MAFLDTLDQTLGEEIRDKAERLKWSLWHGNLYKAFYKTDLSRE